MTALLDPDALTAPDGDITALTAHPVLRAVDPLWWRWRSLLGSGLRLALADALTNAGAGGAQRPGLAAHLSLPTPAMAQAAAHWPRLWLELGDDDACPIRLAPHAQWQELNEPAFAALDDDLRSAIESHVTMGVRRCIARCLHLLGLMPQSSEVTLAPAQAPQRGSDEPSLQFVFFGEDKSAGWTVQLPLSALGAPPDVPRTPVQHDDARFNPLLACRAVFGRQALGARAMRSLHVGDALLLQHPGDAPGRTAWLMAGEQLVARWHGNDANATWSGTTDLPAALQLPPWPTWPENMDNPQDNPIDNGATAPADFTLPAEAVIDAAPQRLARLQRWTAGDVVPLAAPVDGDQVWLRVGGRTLARGRLCALGDSLAFEIIELLE